MPGLFHAIGDECYDGIARRPAASSRLILIRTSSFFASGFASVLIVCFITKMPRLATFWRIDWGNWWSLLVAEFRKTFQSLRLKVRAWRSSSRDSSQFSRMRCRSAADRDRRLASRSRGFPVRFAVV